MKNNFILLILLFCPLFSIYEEGQVITEEHQNKVFDNICFGDYPSETFKLSDFQNKVIWLHFSATWWAPCFGFIQYGEEVEEHWEDNENVAIVDFLDDVGQPYSCSQWGSVGNPNLPIIIDDGDNDYNDISITEDLILFKGRMSYVSIDSKSLNVSGVEDENGARKWTNIEQGTVWVSDMQTLYEGYTKYLTPYGVQSYDSNYKSKRH